MILCVVSTYPNPPMTADTRTAIFSLYEIFPIFYLWCYLIKYFCVTNNIDMLHFGLHFVLIVAKAATIIPTIHICPVYEDTYPW